MRQTAGASGGRSGADASTTGGRTVQRPDGTRRRINRYRHGCQVPKDVSVRLSVTFAATAR
jgi:hypothetical protein